MKAKVKNFECQFCKTRRWKRALYVNGRIYCDRECFINYHRTKLVVNKIKALAERNGKV